MMPAMRLAPLGPVLLALACGPREQPAPAAAPTPAPPDISPAPQDIPPAPPADAPVPSTTSQLHVAARGDASLTVRALGDAVAVFDERMFAVAAPPTAPLVAQPAAVPWSGVFEQPPAALGAPFQVHAPLGGRWPDAVMITVNVAGDRAYPENEVQRFDGKAWRTEPLRESAGLRQFYADYADWQGGAIALRLWATTEMSSQYETDIAARPDEYRAALVRIAGAGPEPPELPRDASLRIVRFAAARTGAISVITDDGRLLRWTPAAGRWTTHEAPELGERDSFELLEGPDDAPWLSLYRDEAPVLQRLSGGAWAAIEPPRPGWAESLAHDGAALWAVFASVRLPDGTHQPAELWRADATGPLRWQHVPLPPLVDPHHGHRKLEYGLDSWSIAEAPGDSPPDGRWPISPTHVVAVGGAVWVAGSWSGGGVALVDRPVAAALAPPRPAPEPATSPCGSLVLTLTELPPDADAPSAITAAIEQHGRGEVALVIAATERARVLAAVWLPSLIHHGDDVDEGSEVDEPRFKAARARLGQLGKKVAEVHPAAAPAVRCWFPAVERLVWAPENMPE